MIQQGIQGNGKDEKKEKDIDRDSSEPLQIFIPENDESGSP